jgi:choline dehydrogenase
LQQEHHDYIVIGAGSAGCALANRLSADPHKSVLLVEAGPRDWNPFIHIPAGISKTYVHPTLNWGYMTEPQPHLNDRAIYWPRGKTLGGSSAINGMIYIRGQAQDYDHWEAAGCVGWGWKDVLPLYRRIERHADGASEWHGDRGELAISHPRFRHPSSEAFIAACQAAGYPATPDFNGADQHGAGFYQFTIRDGIRASSAAAFLRAAKGRPNLTVLTGAQAERILFEGKRACGVSLFHRGQSRTVRAGEVIISAGAVNSPQLLLLSGIGPAEQLRALGIAVIHDLPGVGENLHDHMLVQHLSEVTADKSINRQMRGARLVPEVLRYLLKRDGLLTIGASQAAAFLKSDPALDRPDIQLMFKPYTIEMSPDAKIVPGARPGWTTAASPLRPKSRGWLRLRSADWREPPLMQPNLMADPDDERLMVAGLRMMRRIFAEQPLADIARETLPGPASGNDEELLAYARVNSGSMFHPVGSCRMGGDAMAVVDPQLRVRGLEGLRVADASIMPAIVSGNTNAASIMIGAKAGEMILAGG